MMTPKITVTRGGMANAQNLYDALQKVRRSEVLVGIPQERASRRGEKINNAELVFIHTHGSPIRHIPPRPIIEPAIQADGNRQMIAKELKDAAAAWLSKEPAKAMKFLRRAGIAGSNAAKLWFVDPRNNWAPNAPSTIARKGSDRPLIDSGAMRRALTWVIRQTP